MAAATATKASRKGAAAALFITLTGLLGGCAGSGNLPGSNGQVFHSTGRVMMEGQFLHVYFDTAARRVAVDRFTYEEYGPQGGKMPTIGRCYYEAAVAYTERYWARNEMANAYRRPYPVRPGYVEGRCPNFTSDFMPVGRFDY